MDEAEECTICHEKNDQMLMLTCVHDPCIRCALIRYARESKTRRNAYTCEICGEVTPLDISSIVQLERMLPASKRGPVEFMNKNKRPQQVLAPRQPVIEFSASVPVEPTPVKYPNFALPMAQSEDSSAEVDLLKEIEMAAHNAYKAQHPPSYLVATSRRSGCKEHEDEDVSYYCFGCLTTICPECAIHGTHQGHNVKQIKKAIGEIKQHFINVADRVNKVTARFKSAQEGLIVTLTGLAELHAKHRRSISEFFEVIRKEVAKQQGELLTKLDKLHQANIEIVKEKIEQGKTKKQEAERLAQGVLNVLKKDQLTILQEYSKKTGDFSAKIEKYELEPLDQKVEGLRTVNQSQLREFTSEISDLISKLDFRSTELNLGELSVRNYLDNS